jgi:hypothetical protein
VFDKLFLLGNNAVLPVEIQRTLRENAEEESKQESSLKLVARTVLHDYIILQHVRFEVFTAVTMKNVIFCYIKTQFVLHRRHITSPLQSPAS